MNFLSHYYFEKAASNAYMVMGVVLPDLIKNTDKAWNLYPQKNESLFLNDTAQSSLLTGWKKHLEVDRLFHSSLFFAKQTSAFRQLIVPVLQDSPAKPFFVAHIGLELLIDHLLLVHGDVEVNCFYKELERANSPSLRIFLDSAKLEDQERFFKFLENFLSSRYLLSYQKIENITYALNRICMRIWPNPFTEAQLKQLTDQFSLFAKALDRDYLTIFKEIEMGLNT